MAIIVLFQKNWTFVVEPISGFIDFSQFGQSSLFYSLQDSLFYGFFSNLDKS